MRRFRWLGLVALFAVIAAGCDWPNIFPSGSGQVRYRDQVFSAVTVTNNVTYGSAVNLSGQTITLQLDMYQPSGDTVTSRPAIVWVHGGSFSGGFGASSGCFGCGSVGGASDTGRTQCHTVLPSVWRTCFRTSPERLANSFGLQLKWRWRLPG